MKLGDMYKLAVDKGTQADPRGEKGITRVLEAAKKAYEDLPEKRRWEFDTEKLTNPFADTRILVGNPETEVRTVLAGIDIDVGELLLADRLRERGHPIDLVLGHHPDGRALADVEEVMGVQADIWRKYGVPINLGEAILSERMLEIRRAFHSRNNHQTLAVARLLDLPFMCCHTPADNSVQAFMQAQCDRLDDDATLGYLIELLKSIPEYREAVIQGSGPVLFNGDQDQRTGRIMVDMTGGTSGPKEALESLSAAGVGTIVGMHMSEEHREEARKAHLNVVIAGHMASDSLGINLILDEYERRGIDIIPCSGLIRVSRVQDLP